MAQYFLDTSALAKRYLPETGSRWVQQLCVTESISVSALIIVEINATLARRVREGSVAAGERDVILRRFRRHLRQMTVVDVDLRTLNAAGSLAIQSPSAIPLRSLDAIHIASAQSLMPTLTSRGLGPLTVVSADTRLLAAAQWAGFATDNPEVHP
jgi:predicted nucleic acid-binding protein